MLNQSCKASELNTTVIESLHFLEKHFVVHRAEIETWFEKEWQKTPPPVYGSIDLRNAGFKLAPIDMNLFPAGFNNLNPAFLLQAVDASKYIIHRYAPNAQRILIIPESHTRNMFYWENVKVLKKILEEAQFEVRLGVFADEIKEPFDIILANEAKLIVEPLKRQDDKLYVADFVPDVILLNNDLSSGIPEILQNLQQIMLPPAELGWSQRLKSEHFQYYADVSREFAKSLNFDPWLIAPLFQHCGHIDFMQQEGMECVSNNAEILFAKIQKKYAEYHIPYKPFLVIKADAGTYGMAVMTIRHADELKTLNRKQRTRMATTKGGQPVHRVIIQEGVYTFETIGPTQAVAEPVIYLFGQCVVGGFYRVHQSRGIDENLNAPGMHFEPLAFAQSCNEPRDDMAPDACPNRFYLYGVIAKLSQLAAAREIAALGPQS